MIARETPIVRTITRKLKAIPNSYVINLHGSVYGTAGNPDLLFWVGSVSFAFEGKRVGKKARSLQEVRLERMRRAGVVCAVVHSVYEVRAVLQAYGVSMGKPPAAGGVT